MEIQQHQQHHIKLSEESLQKQTTTLNLGPTHPATHGVFQNIMEIDGERVLDTVSTVGYIHRAFEKIAERVLSTRSLRLQTGLTIAHLLSTIWDGI